MPNSLCNCTPQWHHDHHPIKPPQCTLATTTLCHLQCIKQLQRLMTTDREPTECSESEIRSLSPTFQYLDSYSDKNDGSLILFCDEGSYPDYSLNSSESSTITSTQPVSPFPLVLDNSCCNQPSESSLQLFYTDTSNSSLHPFFIDSPIRPSLSPTPFDSKTELSCSLSSVVDAIGGSWESRVGTANDGIFCSLQNRLQCASTPNEGG